jgi:hypothetical protein
MSFNRSVSNSDGTSGCVHADDREQVSGLPGRTGSGHSEQTFTFSVSQSPTPRFLRGWQRLVVVADFGPAAGPLQKLLQNAGFLVDGRPVNRLQPGMLVSADVVRGQSVEPCRAAEKFAQRANVNRVIAAGCLAEKILPALKPHAGCLGKWQ